MNRLLVFAVVASIGNVSAAFAEDSLLKSGAPTSSDPVPS